MTARAGAPPRPKPCFGRPRPASAVHSPDGARGRQAGRDVHDITPRHTPTANCGETTERLEAALWCLHPGGAGGPAEGRFALFPAPGGPANPRPTGVSEPGRT